MASASIRMSGSAIKVRLMEAEDNPKKQMELLESSSIPQAIGVFGFTVSSEPGPSCDRSRSDVSVNVDTSENSTRTRREK